MRKSVTPDPKAPLPARPAPRPGHGAGAGGGILAGAGRRNPTGLTTLVAVLGVGLVILIILAGCGGASAPEQGETIRFTIPAGTTRLLEKGGTSSAIPEKITARVGDTMVVENRDEATQFIAGYSVSPGQTLKIPLNRSGDYITNCSAHRDRSIRMVVSE